MTDDLWLQRRVNDLKIGFIFLTRLPLDPLSSRSRRASCRMRSGPRPSSERRSGCSAPASMGLRRALHLPPLPAAALAVAATVAVTGALHEDGLADVADGFGGGATRERKLEIMRDSRIGTYGVCALMLSFMLRVSALTNLGDPALVTAVLVAAHAAARAPIASVHAACSRRANGRHERGRRPPPQRRAIAGDAARRRSAR